MFLDVWQARELWTRFLDVWQTQELAKWMRAPRCARGKDVWQRKDLVAKERKERSEDSRRGGQSLLAQAGKDGEKPPLVESDVTQDCETE